MTWYETEDGDLLNLDKVDCVAYEGLGEHVIHFNNVTSYEISESDYEKIKNILLNK